jgi:dolichol-phosphate mannosyltransferase
MPNITVIFPTYNERENIEKLVLAAREIVKPYEIIVVDDDSPDETWKVVQELAARYENIRLMRRRGKRGLASAIAEGIASSRGDVIVWMDCDFSMPLEKVPELINALEENDIAIGSRYVQGGKDKREFSRVVTSRIFNTFASLLLGRSIKDYTTGFIAAKKEVFDKLAIEGIYGEYCIIFLYNARKHGFKIAEVPYTCLPRKQGETKISQSVLALLKHGLRYGITVLRLRWK